MNRRRSKLRHTHADRLARRAEADAARQLAGLAPITAEDPTPADIASLRMNEHGLQAMSFGYAEDDGFLDEAKKRTHDELIKMVGRYRTGPVTWHCFAGDDAGHVLAILTATENRQAYLDMFRRVRALFRENKGAGWFVVATTPATPPDDVIAH